MASRISFYCAVFLGMLLYDTSEALNCYTKTSCSGSGCVGDVTEDPVDTTCQDGLDVCLRATYEVTVSGDKAEYTTLSCSAKLGLENGCSSFDDLPPSVAAAYESLDFDTFEYCLCDQELCNTASTPAANTASTPATNTGSSTATSTLSVMIGTLLFTLFAFFPSGVDVYQPRYIASCGV
ncbi:hypothetical protein HOLleu_29051 [Holothuria leucospilota]|uniref:Uncharacterized protein n=1 Tax=Holothuria leucospilota TaxID=206669 RepID=A0A9Q1H2D4_HOLLE|nr:hypothetical protein HOLleu_29051 [Holothuria leucospilota]